MLFPEIILIYKESSQYGIDYWLADLCTRSMIFDYILRPLFGPGLVWKQKKSLRSFATVFNSDHTIGLEAF